ncbi:hypothetical protein [Winogradskyella eckloniae]|uniref:hypothetical protein n=1 Tax=Winogradskyella eckloniae TaxID=1089306 RepID=UPI0015651391|nr:hypothetical protein [Winogradskyella eckloniae]
MRSTAKTRALFGLSEWLIYGYRYYYGIMPLIGCIVSLYLAFKAELKQVALLAALISFMAILFSIFSIWRLFI